jgi:hypothetical protein
MAPIAVLFCPLYSLTSITCVYKPSGLLAVPFRGADPEPPAVLALAPAFVLDRPSGF